MNQKKLAIVILALIVVCVFFWLQQKENSKFQMAGGQQDSETENIDRNDQDVVLKPSEDYVIRPDFSKVQTFGNTLILQKGVSVRYGSGWVGKKAGDNEFVNGQLTKTLDGRSYIIGFQENTAEFLSSDGGYTNNNLKVYEEIFVNNKSHFVVTSSDWVGGKAYDYAYVSSCPVKADEACSLPLDSSPDLLLVMLRQNVPGAQAPVELDFSREDDQQILAEFTEIVSTIRY